MLTALYEDHKSTYGGRREDYFALLYLGRHWGLPVEKVSHQVAFGGNDYGFDAYHLDVPSRNLYLYQFKWSDNHDLFKGSMERLAQVGLSHVFGDSFPDRNENTVLAYLRSALIEHREAIQAVYLQFVFKGDDGEAERSEGLDSRREDLESKIHLIRTYFRGRDVDLRVQFLTDRPGRVQASAVQSFEVQCKHVVNHQYGERRLLLGFVPLYDLHRIHVALGSKFFDRNIRGSLSERNAPNRKIHDALKGIVLDRVDDPAVFAFRHNGVTIAADRIESLPGGVLKLHVPRLLNGAQSVSMLGVFLDKHAEHPRLQDGAHIVKELQVLAKLIEAEPSSDFVTDVTVANNQQNAVPPWALRAMDRRQVDLADWFRTELGIYYSRQEGIFASLPASERESRGIVDSRDLRIKPMAQTLLAIDGAVANMRRLPEVFTNTNLYRQVFPEDPAVRNPRAIVIAYKAGEMLRGVTKVLRDRIREDHEPAILPAKNLVWALLVQAIYNDRGLEDHLEDFGTSMVRQSGLRELLHDLGSRRVLPLLRALISDPKFAARVEQGKYDFLRTDAAFKRGMRIARDDWGWSHTRL
ncbi:MAG: AIPR family protein [Gemmatimonadales bacterium]